MKKTKMFTEEVVDTSLEEKETNQMDFSILLKFDNNNKMYNSEAPQRGFYLKF